MRATRKAWPLFVLLAEVLAFFRQVLFYGHYAIPWDFRYYHPTNRGAEKRIAERLAEVHRVREAARERAEK